MVRLVLVCLLLAAGCAGPFPSSARDDAARLSLMALWSFLRCSTPSFSGTTAFDTSGDLGQYASIAFSNCEVYVSYQDSVNADVKLAKSTDGGASFKSSIVESTGTVGQDSSIAVDGNSVYISYFTATGADLSSQSPRMVERVSPQQPWIREATWACIPPLL